VIGRPSIAPFHVDASRIGGSLAQQRHSFGLGQPPVEKKKPRFIPPPEKRYLGTGVPANFQLSQAQLDKIQASITPVIEALRYELEAVKLEADWVSGQTLRVEPDLYKSISTIGPYLTPQEVRSTIMVDASEIGKAAKRILTMSLSSYLSPEQRQSLQTIVNDADALVAYIQQFDMTPLTGATAKLAQDHVDSHVAEAVKDIEEVERGIVSTEASGIPVIEPADKQFGIGGLIAVGTLIAVGIIVADLI
jgi:hypothetical protein